MGDISWLILGRIVCTYSSPVRSIQLKPTRMARGGIMAGNDEDFQDSLETIREKRRQEDHDDFHHALAGREVGRVHRFLPPDARGPQSKEHRDRERARQTALEMLLASAEYAALYAETTDLLYRAEVATERTLREAKQALANAEGALNDMLDHANRLPDGTAVFKDADGNVRTADGSIIEGDALAGIVWNERASTYEKYLRKKKAAEEARRQLDKIRRYQVDVLGHARDRLHDVDDPPSLEELDRLGTEIEEQMPDAVRAEVEPVSETPSLFSERVSDLDVPIL